MSTYDKNTGHGHVYPRPDGNQARCGGPALCGTCAKDLARKEAEAADKAAVSAAWPAIDGGHPITSPCIAVPADWEGTETEALALAVAGAFQALVNERDALLEKLKTAGDVMGRLADVFPRTSFAAPEAALASAREWLEERDPGTPT